jgi:hypothetical protein
MSEHNSAIYFLLYYYRPQKYGIIFNNYLSKPRFFLPFFTLGTVFALYFCKLPKNPVYFATLLSAQGVALG